MTDITKYPHGRETYAAQMGDWVIKRPLPTLGDAARDKWLEKQKKTKETTDAIRAVGNPTYHVPEMHSILDDEYMLLEEYARGVPLTVQLFNALSARQKYEIITSLSGFLVDMNELKDVGPVQKYQIASEIKFDRLDRFIENKMSKWFKPDEVRFMADIRDAVGLFEYETCPAWSHCDLNSGNVLYDQYNSKLWIIDFAEADYRFIYRDIFSPLAMELDIGKKVYDSYVQMHNPALYSMPGGRTLAVRDIMKFRALLVFLRRFIKASDDLRLNPANEKSVQNNINKVAFMRDMIARMADVAARAK